MWSNLSEDFSQMVERIIDECELKVTKGKTDIAIINEAMNDKEIVKKFLEKYINAWKKWVKARGPHEISPFLEWVGAYLFGEYLTQLFRFNNSVKAVVKKGKSNVDAQVFITYIYSDGELKKIKELKEKYNIDHMKDEIEIGKFLLSNCVKSIPRFISNIMDIKYRLFTSKVEGTIKEDNSLELLLIYDGRIG